MLIKTIDDPFSVSKITNTDTVNLNNPFTFLSITDDEISLVCKTKDLPANVITVESNWRALKIDGILDFSMIGIIAKISTLLAENNISIFVISTFNTDYILVKEHHYKNTLTLLKQNNYTLKPLANS